MADSYQLIDGKIRPYYGGRLDTNTDNWRDATQLEIDQYERIGRLEVALSELINVACECDNWESFPSNVLSYATDVLNEG